MEQTASKRKSKTVLALALICAAAIGAAIVYIRAYRPSLSTYPVRGIDVSHHQGRIDWQRVANAGIDFAILKATEGGDHVDTLFAQNLRDSKAAGIRVGAYHFWRFCKSGAEQAHNFIATVPADPALLPPVIDIELGGSCKTMQSVDELRRELASFLALVEPIYGKQVVIYITDETLDVYRDGLPDRRPWLRSLFRAPTRRDWIYWQYHNRGSVDGITGPADLDVFNGSKDEFRALAGASPQS